MLNSAITDLVDGHTLSLTGRISEQLAESHMCVRWTMEATWIGKSRRGTTD